MYKIKDVVVILLRRFPNLSNIYKQNCTWIIRKHKEKKNEKEEIVEEIYGAYGRLISLMDRISFSCKQLTLFSLFFSHFL